MGRLQEIAESGEITHTSRAENGESMSLRTYARGLTISCNLLINDDLNLLGDMTAAFGQAAAQTEADILISLLTSNPALTDGTAVIHATRGNLAAGIALGEPDAKDGLSAARKHMRTVKGLDAATIIDAKPKYLVVGPDSETDAEKLLALIYAATTGDVNAFAGKLTLIVEPRLIGPKWFIFADPARLAALQYGYLASAQGVQFQRAEAWDTNTGPSPTFVLAGWTGAARIRTPGSRPMALTLHQLQVARDSLVEARATGVMTFRDQNGEMVTYKSDTDQARALAALDQEIAALNGARPTHTIRFNTSKGLT